MKYLEELEKTMLKCMGEADTMKIKITNLKQLKEREHFEILAKMMSKAENPPHALLYVTLSIIMIILMTHMMSNSHECNLYSYVRDT